MPPTVHDLSGTIFNIMRYSIYDGPGIRTTVFLKGCPASCPWCHNPEALSDKAQLMYRKDRCRHCGDCAAACPHNAISLQDGETVTDRKRCLQCGACVDVCYAEARELLFLGNEESPMNYADNPFPFRQDSSFLYYFGVDQPGFAAIIDLDADHTVIFGDDITLDDIVWTGVLPSVAGLAARAGVEETAPVSALDAFLKKAMAQGRVI